MVGNEFTRLEQDALREVGFIAAGHASRALSELVGESVNVRVPLARVTSLEKIQKILGGPEALVTGIYLPITGDLGGSVLMLFPKKTGLLLADVVQKRGKGTTKKLDDMDKSALKEVGNIISGNCLTALSKFLGLKLIEHVPDLTCDMLNAVMDYVIVKFGQHAEEALVIEIEFNIRRIKIPGYFLLLFGLKDAGIILKSLKKKLAEHSGGK